MSRVTFAKHLPEDDVYLTSTPLHFVLQVMTVDRHSRAVKPAAIFADELRIEGFTGRERVNPRDFAPHDFEAYKPGTIMSIARKR